MYITVEPKTIELFKILHDEILIVARIVNTGKTRVELLSSLFAVDISPLSSRSSEIVVDLGLCYKDRKKKEFPIIIEENLSLILVEQLSKHQKTFNNLKFNFLTKALVYLRILDLKLVVRSNLGRKYKISVDRNFTRHLIKRSVK